ncbi:MAG: hypothetical protein KF773_11885 [Deltaproteobacteria bacterium]|nr:hypothetical protein [Deltaproteobacteria bacterium]MCW5805052.1 hypothetical protein [Deltaproteobacteria bacterium]
MGARETETAEKQSEDVTTEAAAPAPEPPKTEFQEGEIPAVAAGGVDAAATASELAFGDTSDTSHLDRGVHAWEDYKAACESSGQPDKFKPEWRFGYTGAAGWTQPTEKRRDNEFSLKQGHSAFDAIHAFQKGLTITDYRVAAVADQVRELAEDLGARKFDRLFGSSEAAVDAAIPKGQRLNLTPAQYGIPHVDQLRAIAREHDEAGKPADEAAPPTVVEARVEEKPKAAPEVQEPVVVAQELGLEHQDRALV